MEAEAEAERKETGSNVKRKMKTPTQLETLERTYLNDNYPSETVRADLSLQLGLSDRQLQMWFCHRRLKDKKPKKEKEQPAPSPPPPALMANYYGDFDASRNQRGLKPNCDEGTWKKKAHVPSLQHLSPAEVRAIAAVEAQLGEPLQEDGPILGVDFDPLPPGAFDSLTVPILEPYKQGGHHYEKLFDGQDARSNKRSSGMLHTEHVPLATPSTSKRKSVMGNVPTVHSQSGSRAPQEYQFLPEQPSGRHGTYERATKSRFYEPSYEGLASNNPSLSTAGNLMHGHDQLTAGYSFPNQISNSTLLPQENRSAHIFAQDNVDYEGLQHKDSYTGFGYDGHFGSHQGLGADEAYLHSEKHAFYQDQDQARIEKKRKSLVNAFQSEEARIAKEVEAHERRIRKELEKQEIMRRKMEEKQDREKRKEEERMMREKQREEERMQRENRRLIERREKILQKESKRAEKMRHKEELRREKEAARQKAANERATARKLARESVELIEDERLELMEAAASAKGLSSIFLLDDDILLQVEAYKGILGLFPPKSVKMKIPFAVRPWTDSQQNVGNLLMVWRFIITFADVLGLWPFTLDEFVQALHDHDSRILGEIHVSLLKTIVKDIEDVACATSNGLGGNQNNVGLAGGGHPQLVEAAFAWGFDIREWRQHLNPLTWPEVLRQFALAAGFGPQWKKCRSFNEHLRDDNEGQEGEDAVSTLRSGAAAASAVAMMQGKGSGHSRRCRYRLTPGTVKYAAFHVLSLEGGNGLTILEVAEKIQESGLRDLTTSKTPEASIAAALSRDSNLFERVAPSTYCVRPAFRKDPNDAQAVLQAAREKIQSFQSALSDSEEAEKDVEDAEEGERDEEYECDDVEDADADDLDGHVNSEKVIFCLNEGKVVKTVGGIEKEKYQAIESCTRKSMSPEVDRDPKPVFLESAKDVKEDNFKDVSSNGDGDTDSHKVNHMLGETEIDESHTGDPWVQGLMEGEYSDLSVEERLNALVALIGIANEGNTVRTVLEERQEAANALKRQMWAEAQLDKKRLKEEQLSRSQILPFGGIKSEGANNNTLFEGGQNPYVGLDNKGSEASVFHQPKCEGLVDVTSVPNHCLALTNSAITVEKNLLFPDNSPVQETSMAQVGYTSEKSRAQLKASIGLRAEELYVYRSIPLGQDRRHNRYWQFVTCPSGNDPGLGRIFFESHGEGHWKVIDTDEAFDALLASLDTRGVREAHLHAVLQKLESSFKQAVRKRSFLREEIDLIFGQEVKTEFAERTSYPGCVMEDASHGSTIDMSRSFSIDLGRNNVENKHALERYMDFEKWLWIECIKPSALNAVKLKKKRCLELLRNCEVCHEVYWSRDKHCSFCHATFESPHKFEVKFSQHVLDCEEKKRRKDPSWMLEGPSWALPSRVQLLKVAIAAVEASIPPEALQTFWTEGYRRSWGLSLKSATSPDELLQIITQLEGAINRDWLSSTYETTKELLDFISGDIGIEENSFRFSEVPVLPWIPHTTAAVALRLMAFDHSLSYSLDQKAEKQAANDFEDTSKILSNVAVKKFQELEVCDKGSPSDEERKEDTWTDPANGRNTRGRRGGRPRGRGRGGKTSTSRIESGFNKDSKRKLHFSHSEGGTFGTNEDQKTVRGKARRGRASKRGRGRGACSSRQMQPGIQKRDVKQKQPNHFTNSGMGIEKRFSVELGEDDESSDGSQSIEGEEWERHDHFGEGENNVDNHYIEEDNIVESSEQDDDIDEACEDAQATEDEFEDVDMKYENKYFARDNEAEDSEPGEAVDADTESGDEDEEDEEDGSMLESSKNSD